MPPSLTGHPWDLDKELGPAAAVSGSLRAACGDVAHVTPAATRTPPRATPRLAPDWRACHLGLAGSFWQDQFAEPAPSPKGAPGYLWGKGKLGGIRELGTHLEATVT